MTKPVTFIDKIYPEKRCSLCEHCYETGHVTLGSICLLGGVADKTSPFLVRNGEDVELLEGDELDAVWVACTIFDPDTSVCDNFEPKEGGK